MKFAVMIEKGKTGYGAYVPDLPGCVAAGKSVAEVRKLIAEAITFHLEGLRDAGEPLPRPASACEYVEVS